jgi:hypothetical protein
MNPVAGRLEEPFDNQPSLRDEETFAVMLHRPAQGQVRLKRRGLQVGELNPLHRASLPPEGAPRKGASRKQAVAGTQSALRECRNSWPWIRTPKP